METQANESVIDINGMTVEELVEFFSFTYRIDGDNEYVKPNENVDIALQNMDYLKSIKQEVLSYLKSNPKKYLVDVVTTAKKPLENVQKENKPENQNKEHLSDERKNLLEQLHNTKFTAVPTVQTYDMGIEYDFVSAEGWGSELGSLGRWPLYKLPALTKPKLSELKSKIQDETISVDDIKETGIDVLYNQCFTENVDKVSKFLDSLMNIEEQLEDYIYCFCDITDYYPNPVFFETKQELLDYFQMNYCCQVNDWEDLDDEELAEWLERIQEGDLQTNCFFELCYKEEVND